jgi:hypothetical protein
VPTHAADGVGPLPRSGPEGEEQGEARQGGTHQLRGKGRGGSGGGHGCGSELEPGAPPRMSLATYALLGLPSHA